MADTNKQKVVGADEQLTATQVLNGFHNGHLSEIMKLKIQINVMERLDPEEQWAAQPVRNPGNPEQVLMRKIKVKEALEADKKQLEQQELFLAAIEALQEEYKGQ